MYMHYHYVLAALPPVIEGFQNKAGPVESIFASIHARPNEAPCDILLSPNAILKIPTRSWRKIFNTRAPKL